MRDKSQNNAPWAVSVCLASLILLLTVIVSCVLAAALYFMLQDKPLETAPVDSATSREVSPKSLHNLLKHLEQPRDDLIQEKKSNRGLVKSREDRPEPTDPAILNIDVSKIYTKWSKWSKCRRKCKQVRKRFCIVPSICGSNVLKEERPCKKGRCRRQNFHIVKRKKLSRKTRGMLKFNKAFYTKWSKWSTCSKSCKTTRTRSCKFALICGSSSVHEEAYCYMDGSLCEDWYRQGKSLSLVEHYRNGRIDEEDLFQVNRVEEHLETPISKEQKRSSKPTIDLGQCGVLAKDNDPPMARSNPAWALRIIGGREATRGHWPWQVAILNKYKEVFCGGTLVAPGWILTAAHCVRKHLYVRIGEHDLVINEGTEREYFVEHSILHPDYNPDTVDSDVALLKIPMEDSDLEHPNLACLPKMGQTVPVGKKCTIIGWGKEKSSHVYGTDVLHEAEIPIVPKSECLNVYKDYFITSNMFCAGYQSGRIDSCAGDSGGPLLCEDDGHWTVYGVTSFGEGCGREGKFGIYAQVPNFVTWIDSVVNYR